MDKSLKDMFLENDSLRTIKYHHYLDIYERYLSRYKGKEVNILEIGIYEGGSLELYKKYCGDGCNVFGIDILPACKNIENLVDNCKVFIGDAGSPEFIDLVIAQLPKMDIIIDDGGHYTAQQILAFEKLFPILNDFGIYICEDLHTNYWKQYIDTPVSFVDYVLSRMPLLNKSHDTDGIIKIEDNIWKDQVLGVYFLNSIIAIEKKPIALDLNTHERTGLKNSL